MKHIAIVLSTLCLFITVSCQLTRTPTPSQKPLPLSILQGATDQTSTQINILAPANRTYKMTLAMENSFLENPKQTVFSYPESKWQLIQIDINGLTPELTYTLRIYDNNELIDERYFKTLAKDPNHLRVFVASCLSDYYDKLQKKQWQQISEQKPDLLFLIGDNVYVDRNPYKSVNDISEQHIWNRYVDTRQSFDLYKMKNLIPTFATWDDHDYGANDGNSSFVLKDFSKKIFKLFFPMNENSMISSGPGVASAFKIKNQQFLLLDDRYFRTALKATPQSHFGKEQNEWIFEKIKSHKGPTWLISGDQFFGDYHSFESFAGNHPQDFKEFIKNLKKINRPVVFVSGDRHIAELMKIEKSVLGYQTYEITSSGLHTKMFPDALEKNPNKRRIFGKDGESNYLDLKIDLMTSHFLSFETQFWGEDFKMFFQEKYKVSK